MNNNKNIPKGTNQKRKAKNEIPSASNKVKEETSSSSISAGTIIDGIDQFAKATPTNTEIIKKIKRNPLLIDDIHEKRLQTANSIIDFNFNKQRIRILSENIVNVKASSNGILYWMTRDQRVQDNWTFLFAQKLAIKNQIPLHVCFCLLPKFGGATRRQYKFMFDGFTEIVKECQHLNIPFHLLKANNNNNHNNNNDKRADVGVEASPPHKEICKFMKTNGFGAIVCDFSPLKVARKWLDDLLIVLPNDIPICQVDAHNIVPIWIASDKQEYSARTIRNKINGKLDTYLTEFPPLIKHPYVANDKNKRVQMKINWNDELDNLKIDHNIKEVDWAIGGYTTGIETLRRFCEERLIDFDAKRNDPLSDVLSNLSPWFHFGQISVQRCITIIKSYKRSYPESVASFMEEAIIRRELSDNYCYYNSNYDNINGLHNWAQTTLNIHKKDKREYLYNKSEFENAKTHDDLWNSAQIQLCTEGKMHGFLRMYWAKKILEWSESPEVALEIAIYLNDRYSLDGRDPNGYVGCMWSIGGLHDQGWKERNVFGKIRFMNYEGCKRKFNVKEFVEKYGGVQYLAKKIKKK